MANKMDYSQLESEIAELDRQSKGTEIPSL